MKIEFLGFNPFVKQFRTDKGFRVEFDVSLDQYDAIKDIPKLEEGVYKITIEQDGGTGTTDSI